MATQRHTTDVTDSRHGIARKPKSITHRTCVGLPTHLSDRQYGTVLLPTLQQILRQSVLYMRYFWKNDRWTAASSVKTTSTLYAPRNRNKVILVLLLTVQLHIVSTILNYRRNKKQNKYLNDRFVDQEIETTTYYCCSSHWPRCPPPVRATCGATTKYILHKSLSSIPRFCRPPVQRRLVV